MQRNADYVLVLWISVIITGMTGNTGLRPHRRKVGNDFAVVSNQWQSNPKQQLFLYNYFEPTSKTFGNVFQSAIAAGYKESYARTLTRKSNKNMWLSEYASMTQLQPEHIVAGITNIATSMQARPSERLKAYELLGKISGMFIDRSANVSVNIEAALSDLV